MELTTTLVIIGGLVASVAAIVVVVNILSAKKARQMAEGLARLRETYGLAELPDGGFTAEVDGVEIEVVRSRVPVPATDPLAPQRRHLDRPGYMTAHMEDALRVSATCSPDQQWFLCENRTDYRYGEDKVTDYLWHEWGRSSPRGSSTTCPRAGSTYRFGATMGVEYIEHRSMILRSSSSRFPR